jgi:hypothetical protein
MKKDKKDDNEKTPKTIKELKNFLMKFPGKTTVYLNKTEQIEKIVYSFAFEVKREEK